ncbi:hypothetical protein ACLB2K_038366 [Fragaria x ananassa]
MVGSQPTQNTGSAPSMEQISQMLKQLTSQSLATQQSITDLAGKVDNLAEQAKRDKTLWEADQHNLVILTEDFNRFAGEVREDKNLVNGSLQQIQKDLNQNTKTMKQNTKTVKQHAEILSLTHATVDEQTLRLDDHDAKMHDQQNASFFGSKNSLEKLVLFFFIG